MRRHATEGLAPIRLFPTQRAAAALFLLAFLTGCGGSTPQQSEAEGLPAEEPAVANDEVTVAPQPVRAACAQVAAILGAMPADSLTVSERVVTDYLADRSGPGCRVRLDGLASSYGSTARPNDVVREALPTRGWNEDFGYAADGPDGTGFALRWRGVTCLFQGMWDGGDDADPTDVPADRYALEVNCLESGAGQ
ncbi:MAG: hypothetical protein OER90_01985 [Gemmatimonadota bacterium]|nr:hypothetical protein [Gemmatimonadota bacterium]